MPPSIPIRSLSVWMSVSRSKDPTSGDVGWALECLPPRASNRSIHSESKTEPLIGVISSRAVARQVLVCRRFPSAFPTLLPLAGVPSLVLASPPMAMQAVVRLLCPSTRIRGDFFISLPYDLFELNNAPRIGDALGGGFFWSVVGEQTKEFTLAPSLPFHSGPPRGQVHHLSRLHHCRRHLRGASFHRRASVPFHGC